MNYSGDAAEQVVRLSLETGEVAAKIIGAGAMQVAALMLAVMREQKKTKGKTRLSNMLRSGKELKVFAVSDADLQRFCTEAKKYGVLYCVLKDRDANDGITDIMVRAEDAAKINRIFERFQLATVDIGEIRSEIARDPAKEERAGTVTPEASEETKDAFLDALLQPAQEETQVQNPTEPQPESRNPSEPISTPGEDTTKPVAAERPSVRAELREIREEQKKSQTASPPTRKPKAKTKPKKKVKEK